MNMSFTQDGRSLRFNENGKFKIMQVTDLHISKTLDTNTRALFEKALDRERPDLVVLTGDQVMGYGLTFLLGDKRKKVRRVIDSITEPLAERGLRFAATFGNHDPQSSVSLEEQSQIYREKAGCVMPSPQESFGPGTFNLPIYSSDGARAVFDICLINSNASKPGGGYEPVSREQIEWVCGSADALAAQNGGGRLPTIVFQHIPVREMYSLLEETESEGQDSVPAYRAHRGKHFILGEASRAPDAFLGEAPSAPDENTGEFDALAGGGNVLAIFFGHDHCNSFTGKLGGVTLGYTQGASFREYGAGVNRGVRIIELDEREPGTFATRTLSYVNMFGPRAPKKGRLRMLLTDCVPTSIDAAVPFIIKCVLGLAALVGLITALILI